jgi:hypothetical protein
MSQRTDGGPKMANLPNPAYGEQASFQQAQQGAPMGAPGTPAATTPASGGPSLTPLNAPSARPDEPVTAGAALGAGVGPEALGLDAGSVKNEGLEKLRPYLPVLMFQANRPESTQEFRNYVRNLRAQLR